MSAFGSPWGDIDRTPPGAPYVVDSDGWGWFALFILMALPFFIIGIFMIKLTEAICAHPYISVGLYIAFAIIVGIVFYHKKNKRWRALGVIATIITFFPFAMVEGFYMIPYIMQNSLFVAVFEWIFVSAVVGGITIFIMMISRQFDSGMVHFALALIFASIVFMILNHFLSSSDEINWNVVFTLYELNLQ